MIITDLDSPLTAEDARKVSLANRDDSDDRRMFRTIMQRIHCAASFGYTRYQSVPMTADQNPSQHVVAALTSMGYRVIVKKAYKWDDDMGKWSDKPLLGPSGRELSFFEITWG